MEKVILITDLDTELGYHLLKQYYLDGYRILGFTKLKAEKLTLQDFNREYLEICEWNRTSPVGVKNLLLKGVARFKEINEAILLQSAHFSSSSLRELPFAELNQAVDFWIKGQIFLLKDLLGYFSQHTRGVLTLVNNITCDDEPGSSPLAGILHAAFKSLVANLFKSLKENSVCVNAMESDTRQYEKLSEFIFKTINEKAVKTSGKYFNYYEKKSLLNAFR